MSGFNTKRRFVISARNAKDATSALSKKKWLLEMEKDCNPLRRGVGLFEIEARCHGR